MLDGQVSRFFATNEATFYKRRDEILQRWLGGVHIHLSGASGVGFLFLLLASHTVGSGRVEEPATALLAPTVAIVLSTNRTAEAVHQTREKQTGTCSPHESESLDPELGTLTIAAESVPGLHVDSPKYSVSIED